MAARRFYTSDHHFGHLRIIELCDRPFHTVDEMNERMIQEWNNVVGVDDTVIHLGDVALGVIAQSLPLVGRLNGFKYLIPGNHDRIFSGANAAERIRFLTEYEKVFDGIMQEISLGWFIGEHEVVMSHFPYEGDSHHDERFADKRPPDDGLPIICGHVHNVWDQRLTSKGTLMVNVGVDVRGFAPVDEEELEAILSDR
jgi:calcineurin-like phosphoesterase family protein